MADAHAPNGQDGRVNVSLLAALAGTLAYGAGSVLQAVGAARASGPAVLRNPAYLAGLGCDAVAWLASIVALRQLPLFVVQSLLAGSLGVTVLLAAVFLGARLSGRDLTCIAVVIAALAVVAAASGEQSARPAPGGFVAVAIVALVLTAGFVVAAYGRTGWLAMAAAAGLAFSGAALAARAVQTGAGPGSLVTQPLAWAVLGFGALGAVAYARSLERGAVGPATAVLWGIEVVVPGAVGVAVLGDGVRSGWAAPAVLAVLSVAIACAVLATSPAQPGGPAPVRLPDAPAPV